MDDFDRLIGDLDDAGDQLADRADRLVRACTLQTEALGKAEAPVQTGFLRSSIGSEFERGPNHSRGETGPDTSYDIFVHGGTSRQAPNPFMDRAAAVVEPQFYAGAAAIAGSLLDG